MKSPTADVSVVMLGLLARNEPINSSVCSRNNSRKRENDGSQTVDPSFCLMNLWPDLGFYKRNIATVLREQLLSPYNIPNESGISMGNFSMKVAGSSDQQQKKMRKFS